METELDKESFDTSNKEEVNKARKKAARTRADRLKFVAAAMKHPEGRAWFRDIMNFCRIFENPFDSDPYRSAFTCGMRNVGLNILGDIQDAAPDEYLLLVKEKRDN